MYSSKEEAKKAAKLINPTRSEKNKIVGSYYCRECDAYHNTSQDQCPSRVKWFKEYKKRFNNKHR